MSQFVYERAGFHFLCFLLGLHPECSISSSLSRFDLCCLRCVWFHAFAQVIMAPVVRVDPCERKLLDSNPELLAKVEVDMMVMLRAPCNSFSTFEGNAVIP